MGRYVTLSTIKQYLGKDGFNTLKENAIDVTENYFKGETTNALKTVSDALNVDSFSSTSSNIISTFANLKDKTNNADFVAMGENLAKGAFNTVTTLTKDLIQNKIDTIIPDTVTLTNLVTTYYYANLKSVEDIISDLTKDTESEINEQKGSLTDLNTLKNAVSTNNSSYTLLNSKSKMLQWFGQLDNKLNTEITYVHNFTSKISSYVNDKVYSLTSYVQKGPEWITEQVDDIVNSAMNIITTEVNNKSEILYNIRDTGLNTIGSFVGKQLAYTQNNIIKKEQEIILHTAQTTITDAKSQAALSLQKTLETIMTLTGNVIQINVEKILGI